MTLFLFGGGEDEERKGQDEEMNGHFLDILGQLEPAAVFSVKTVVGIFWTFLGPLERVAVSRNQLWYRMCPFFIPIEPYRCTIF